MIAAAVTFALVLMAPQHPVERVWLTITASSSSPADIVKKARAAGAETLGGLVVRTADCGDARNVFAWVPVVSVSASTARASLASVQHTVKDAYLKPCDVRPGTLLAFRVTAVDTSIAGVPATAVNWSDRDRLSSVHPLSSGRAVIVSRYYSHVLDDPLEGRRERVLLVDSARRQHEIEHDCVNAEAFVVRREYLALQCATEQAAEHMMHRVTIVDTTGRRVFDQAQCRDPSWVEDTVIACKAESVRADGQLVLVPTHIRIRTSR